MFHIRTAVITCFAYANSLAVMMWIIATELDLSTNQRGLMFVGGWIGGLIFSASYVARHPVSQ